MTEGRIDGQNGGGNGAGPTEALARPPRLRGRPPETALAAVRELQAGVKAPIVCRRFGVSERTLYRWRRWFTDVATPPPTRQEGPAPECCEALRAVLASIAPGERARALSAAQAATRLSAAAVRRLAETEL